MLSTTEAEYIVVSETVKNIVITRGILHKLNIILEDFAFSLLIDNTGAIVISGGEKVTRNARHIDIHYHHIRDLIEKKTIEISHILTGEMAADGLTKMLLLNKFKEFIELIRVSKIEASNDEPNDGEASSNDKNNEKFMANYYEEAGKEANKEADKEVSFKAEEAG